MTESILLSHGIKGGTALAVQYLKHSQNLPLSYSLRANVTSLPSSLLLTLVCPALPVFITFACHVLSNESGSSKIPHDSWRLWMLALYKLIIIVITLKPLSRVVMQQEQRED